MIDLERTSRARRARDVRSKSITTQYLEYTLTKFSILEYKAFVESGRRSSMQQLIETNIQQHTVRSIISEGSFLFTHCHQICIRKEISRPCFL